MELLLNLVWMLMALPAWWLWRQHAKKQTPGFSRYQCLWALTCLVVLLFPVISASDDLSAVRTEMEESGPGAASVRAAEAGKSTPALKGQQSAAVASAGPVFTAGPSRWREPDFYSDSRLVSPRIEHGGRAPPSHIV